MYREIYTTRSQQNGSFEQVSFREHIIHAKFEEKRNNTGKRSDNSEGDFMLILYTTVFCSHVWAYN